MKTLVDVTIQDKEIEKAVRHLVNKKVRTIIKAEINKMAQQYYIPEYKKKLIEKEMLK